MGQLAAISSLYLTKQPVRKEDVSYSFMDALKAAVTKDKIKDTAKAINATCFWAGRLCFEEAPKALVNLGLDMGHFKNFLSGWELLSKGPELVAAACAAGVTRSASAVYQVVVKSAGFCNSFYDGLSCVNRYYTILGLRTLGTINSAATMIFAGDGAMEQCGKMIEAQTEEQKVLALLKLSMNVSYVSLGIVAFSGAMAWTAVNTPLIMVCYTLGTLFGLVSYFYEKMYDPLNTNESVNWDKFKKSVRVA